jgi:hypothetical protein
MNLQRQNQRFVAMQFEPETYKPMCGNAQKYVFPTFKLKAARANFPITRKVSIKENDMGLGMILLIILVLALVGQLVAGFG